MSEDFWNNPAGAAVRKNELKCFEELALPHLNAAYNLARWLTGNEPDAQDVVQEAYLRALRSFNGFRMGQDARPWLLKIVRNTCFTWLRRNRPLVSATPFDENALDETPASFADPETTLIRKANAKLVREALAEISLEYREVLVLREMEGLAYKEIAEMINIPLGTVMSRLSRGRKELQLRLQKVMEEQR